MDQLQYLFSAYMDGIYSNHRRPCQQHIFTKLCKFDTESTNFVDFYCEGVKFRILAQVKSCLNVPVFINSCVQVRTLSKLLKIRA